MENYILALTTCPPDKAEDLARILVDGRFCACVNIVSGVRSIYHWKDKVETDTESILLIKTEKRLQDRLWDAIRDNHPYEVPEFVVIPIQGGSKAYLEWISTSTAN
ncbi:MAG: divalent-cation tolerance protein CutA [Candidatus Thorarchaeota archaeon]|nr:MAG: divalent-cation tolerance protein CutA [Candidatus Thorarchaeota archaeon]